MKYKFDEKLKEAIVIKRNSQFTMDIEIDGKVEKAHCPTTNRIGDLELKNVACLVSKSEDPKRKLKWTVEAISCDDLSKKIKTGLELIKYFLIGS